MMADYPFALHIPSSKSAIIAMSGGVDSSVAALLMCKQGYQCIGATMQLFHNEDIGVPREKTCCSLEDVEDARAVAFQLGIPYYVFNFSDTFQQQVIDRFTSAYQAGMTPNPCIDCNHYLKFGKLLQRAQELGFYYVVTGHYARIRWDQEKNRYLLYKGADRSKDQTYMLYTLTQEQLSHIQFPLGELQKSRVREIAAEHGLLNARKRDSQDICFVPDGDYAKFIEQYTGTVSPPGSFVDHDGRVLGTHKGIIRYTIGQRKGLGLSLSQPMYVCRKSMEENAVVLGNASQLYLSSLIASDINWIAIDMLTGPMNVCAKTRYSQKEQPAQIFPLSDGSVRVTFETPQRALTPGQAVVFYQDDLVIGGGVIRQTLPE